MITVSWITAYLSLCVAFLFGFAISLVLEATHVRKN